MVERGRRPIRGLRMDTRFGIQAVDDTGNEVLGPLFQNERRSAVAAAHLVCGPAEISVGCGTDAMGMDVDAISPRLDGRIRRCCFHHLESGISGMTFAPQEEVPRL